jgi:formate dehydrogenase major subunit
LEVHPADAARLGLCDGEYVRLVSARSSAMLPARASTRVREGELFTTFHFPGSDVNSLLSSSADESSKCPEYKVSTVRVERIEEEELDPEDEAERRRVHSRIGTVS